MIEIISLHRRKLVYLLVDFYFKNQQDFINSFDNLNALTLMLHDRVDVRDNFISEKKLKFDVKEWGEVSLFVAKKLRFDLLLNPVYNTQAIVDLLSFNCRKIKELYSDLSFNQWRILFLEKWCHFRNELPAQIAEKMPYGEDVHARIYHELYGVMPFSRDFIFKNYENNYKEKEYLVFPVASNKPDKLIIFFSGNVGRKTYNRYSWYWDEKEEWSGDSVYLFLNDIDSHWYVGAKDSNEFETYLNIIKIVMNYYGITPEKVYAVGGSMGGYAAILFAISMRLKAAIAVNPQLCFRSALRYKEPSWEKKIRECGENFRDLSDEVFRFDSRPIIYIEQSLYEADQVGFDDFFKAIRKSKSFLILKQTDKQDHVTNNPTKSAISSIVNFIEVMSNEEI